MPASGPAAHLYKIRTAGDPRVKHEDREIAQKSGAARDSPMEPQGAQASITIAAAYAYDRYSLGLSRSLIPYSRCTGRVDASAPPQRPATGPVIALVQV
jgi:hypothetical protein